jgi:hypothetical protein
MKTDRIITFGVALMAAAMFSACSRSTKTATPHVTITADQGTNVTVVTDQGHT